MGRTRGCRTLVALVATGTMAMSVCSIVADSSAGAASAASKANAWMGKPAHGSPIKIGWLVDLTFANGAFVPYSDDVQSEVKAANHVGGIHGHPIDLVTCDLADNLNTAAACGQQLVSDHVVGVISLPQEDTFMPYLKKAGIPVLSVGGISPALDSDSNAFALDDQGALAQLGQMGELKAAGCTSVASLIDVPNVPAAYLAVLAAKYQAAAEHFGMSYGGNFTVPNSAPNDAATLDQAAAASSCILTTSGGPSAIGMLNEAINLVQEGKITKISDYAPSIDSPTSVAAELPLIAQLGTHLLVVGGTESPSNTGNPVVAKFVHDTTAYNSVSSPPLTSISEINWVDLQLLIQSANAVYPKTAKSPKVTAKSVLNYMNHLKSWWPGLFPVVSLTQPPSKAEQTTLGFGPRDFNCWAALFTFTTDGQSLPRSSAFLSVLTGKTSNNPVPLNAKAAVDAFE
jgi:hypothetical protein